MKKRTAEEIYRKASPRAFTASYLSLIILAVVIEPHIPVSWHGTAVLIGVVASILVPLGVDRVVWTIAWEIERRDQISFGHGSLSYKPPQEEPTPPSIQAPTRSLVVFDDERFQIKNLSGLNSQVTDKTTGTVIFADTDLQEKRIDVLRKVRDSAEARSSFELKLIAMDVGERLYCEAVHRIEPRSTIFLEGLPEDIVKYCVAMAQLSPSLATP